MPRKKRVNKLFTLDTETIGLGGDIKRIAVYDGQEVTYGYTFDDVEWVFEKSYKPSETFQERVQIERDELAVKVEKLRTFLDKTNVETEIGINQYRLLIKQLTYMENYLAILDIRLEDFK